MNSQSAIKVPTATRDRLRDAAKAAHVSQASLIDQMLADREEAEFWDALTQAPAYTDQDWADLREAEAASLGEVDRALAAEESA